MNEDISSPQSPDSSQPVPTFVSIAPLPQSRKWIVWVFIVCIGITILFAGGYYFLSNQKQKTIQYPKSIVEKMKQPAPTTDLSADWKSYENPIYTYSFQYPPSFFIRQEALDGSYVELGKANPPPDGTITDSTADLLGYDFGVRVEPMTDVTLQEEIANLKEQFKDRKSFKVEETTLDTFEKVKATKMWDHAMDWPIITILSEYQGNKYAIYVLYYSKGLEEGRKKNPEAEQQFDLLLSSFLFSNPQALIISTKDWKTYKGKDFSFQYPSAWVQKPQEVLGSSTSQELSSSDGVYTVILTQQSNYNNKTAKKYSTIDEFLENIQGEKRYAMFDGYGGIRLLPYTTNSQISDETDHTAFFAFSPDKTFQNNSEFIYILEMTTKTSGNQAIARTGNKTFTSILSTLKFTQ